MALISAMRLSLPAVIRTMQSSMSTQSPAASELEQTIEISLEYQGNRMVFPVNPERLDIKRSTANHRYEVLGQGEMVLPNRASLVEVNFTSIFWAEFANQTSGQYLSWINEWRWSRRPGRLVIVENDPASTYHGLNILVLFESMDTNEGKAGAEEDVYFSLNLIQWVGDEPQ